MSLAGSDRSVVLPQHHRVIGQNEPSIGAGTALGDEDCAQSNVMKLCCFSLNALSRRSISADWFLKDIC